TQIHGGVIVTDMIALSTILNKALPGQSTPLLIDLPMMGIPKLNNVLKKTWYRTLGFMKEASTWFFIGALGVGILQITGILELFTKALEPLTVYWLKLPKEAAIAFVMGTVRRDFGAAGLFDLTLTPMQVAVSLIVITLFVPCIASFMVMLKERGWKEGMLIWLSAWVIAFIVGGLTALVVI
ncbi:MAG: ferrous iron transporter B, partial [Ignavibacteriales bacterium UTCHB3]